MKYLMLETSDGMKLPVIFPDTINHDLMATVFAYAIQRQMKNTSARPVSAGFIGFDKVSVGGKSESLNMPHNPIDAARIMMGEAVSFMPDAMLPALVDKMQHEEAKRG